MRSEGDGAERAEAFPPSPTAGGKKKRINLLFLSDLYFQKVSTPAFT